MHHKNLNNYDYLEQMLKNGANANALSNDSNSLLHGIRDGQNAQLLIKYGACVDQKNKKGQTPLFMAMNNAHFEVARVLLKAGAHINERDKKNNTPLHYAVASERIAEIKFLLYNGADADQPNNDGITAYQIALERKGDILDAFEACRKVLF